MVPAHKEVTDSLLSCHTELLLVYFKLTWIVLEVHYSLGHYGMEGSTGRKVKDCLQTASVADFGLSNKKEGSESYNNMRGKMWC